MWGAKRIWNRNLQNRNYHYPLSPICFYFTRHNSEDGGWYILVMGSIEENKYRYSIDTLAKVSIVSILRYPSKNPHQKLHIHKLVTYFDFRTSNFLGFFAIAQFPGYFHFRLLLFFFLAFLVTIPVTIPSIDT